MPYASSPLWDPPPRRSPFRRAMVLAAAIAVVGATAACSSIDSPGPLATAGPDNRPLRAGGELRIALAAEPDILDPTLARTLVGRTVFNAICEKLYDVDEKLTIVPQLASALPEVSSDGKTVTVKVKQNLKFADGTTMDASAVKTSLDRHRTLKGSARTSELSSMESVEAPDASTVVIKLKAPFAPITAVLADRAGMVLSPAALNTPGKEFGTNPVCVGPFKFQNRIAQDRIEVVKDPNYYNASAVKLDKVIYKIIADANTRFNNLRSGDVDVQDGVAATDVDALKADTNLRLIASESLGYQGITINVANANGVRQPPGQIKAPYAGPLSSQAAVRRAFALSLDRDALNRVVFRSQFTVACGPISPASPLSSDAAQACPKHDPTAAKALLTTAGVTMPVKATLIIGTDAVAQRIGTAIQAQAKDGGFDIQLQPVEFAASLTDTDAGKFQMFQIGWSGRVDPDGNIANFWTTKGSQNISGYSNPEMDKLIDEARATTDVSKRRDLYGQVVTKMHEEAALVYLWRQKNFTGVTSKVGGVVVYGDGLLRFATAGFFA